MTLITIIISAQNFAAEASVWKFVKQVQITLYVYICKVLNFKKKQVIKL